MTPQKFYLVSVLIEHSDYETTDCHQLLCELSRRTPKQRRQKSKEGMLNFSNREGELRHDLPHLYE